MSELTSDELALWHAWKTAADQVRSRVAADITAATGLSDPDFAILTRLTELGPGALRQSRLAESLGFHRSRLSHQLSRMDDRGLLTRAQIPGGVEVRITETGRDAVRQARPIHANAVRRHLLAPLSRADPAAFRAALEQILR